MLDGFSGVDLLENTMPIEDVCRLAAEANERLSIAFVVVGSRVPLGAPAAGRARASPPTPRWSP